jgi:orotidine-5'-phosphate decarboxylase
MKDRIILALDFPTEARALATAEFLREEIGAVKVGLELFVSAGPDLVRKLVSMGHKVFLDLKLHDIPNTVAGAARAAARLGVWMMNLHASGGPGMMRAAADAVREEANRLNILPPKLIGVTVLTSLDETDLATIGMEGTTDEAVLRLARLCRDAGLDGVVCSAQEAGAIRDICGENFLRITPGVRPKGADQGDQKRVMTPSSAIAGGSSYLVIGRPITAAHDPIIAARTLFNE